MLTRFHISSLVRSLVTGSCVAAAGKCGWWRCGAGHQHFVDALERHGPRLDADHGVGAAPGELHR